MHDEKDEQLTQLLLRNVPSRDPLFRVKVLERRERRRFQRNVLQLLLAGVVIALALAVGVSVGGGASEAVRAVALVAGMAVAITVYVPLIGRLWRASIGGFRGN